MNAPKPPFCYYQGILGFNPDKIIYYQDGFLHINDNKLQATPSEALELLEQNCSAKMMGFFSFEFGLKLLNLPIRHQKCPDFYFIQPTEYLEPTFESIPCNQGTKTATSNLTETEYNKKIAQIKDLLTHGQTYQVNFAQELNIPTNQDPLSLFQKLHALNPSPKEALLVTEDFSIISNSPESLFIKNGQNISTFPIKGTAPRNQDPAQDQENINNLLNSKKEAAELEMIVDLERNDLGQIALPGTVKVSRHRYIQSYQNVHHTISQIDATLPKNIKFSQVIKALFPGGSITGCPKKRTSKFIHELEPTPRGCYCGSLGFLDNQGDANFNILIRTIFLQNNLASFHAGGGITIQSADTAEYAETFHKARTILQVLQ